MALDRTTGIGDFDDLRFKKVYHYTTEDLEINPVGIIMPVTFPLEGVTADLIDKMDAWVPIVHRGYLYHEDAELYLYADKRTEIWSLLDILTNPRTTFSTGSDWTIIPAVPDYNAAATKLAAGVVGHFTVKLHNVPQEDAPLVLYRLPYDLSQSQVVEGETARMLDAPGLTCLASDFIRMGDYNKYHDAAAVLHDYAVPLYARQSNLTVTGFVELGPTGFVSEHTIVDASHHVHIIPVVCVSAFVDTITMYAQFLPEAGLLRIPGEPGNFLLSYESADTTDSPLQDLDVNPITAMGNMTQLSIIPDKLTNEKILVCDMPEAAYSGSTHNVCSVHVSVTNDSGLPIEGEQVSLTIQNSYVRRRNGVAAQIVPTSEVATLQAGRLYSRVELSAADIVDGDMLFDTTDLLLAVLSENASLTQTIQSHGAFICHDDGAIPPRILTRDAARDAILVTATGIELKPTFRVAQSGVLLTNQYGSGEAAILVPLNTRTTIRTTYQIAITGQTLTKSFLVTPSVNQERTSSPDAVLPDLRVYWETFGGTSVSAITNLTPAGCHMQREPLGLHQGVIFYALDTWYNYVSGPLPTPLGYGLSTVRTADGIFIVPPITIDNAFVTAHGGVVAVYYHVQRDIMKLDDYEVVT